MIERERGDRYIICDQCEGSATANYPEDEFLTMVSEAKGEGWSIIQTCGHWVHICPECMKTH